MAATVSAKIFERHEKNDGTVNVKYIVYHQGDRRHIDSPHFLSKRQITSDYEIKDKVVLKWVDEQLEEYRKIITDLRTKIDFLTCEELCDYLRDFNKEIDIIEFANEHIDFLKRNGREPYSRTFRKIRNSLIDYFGRPRVSINEIHSNMLFAYERFLKTERTQVRINQLKKLVTTKEKGLSNGGLHAHMRDMRTLFNEARKKYNNEDLDIIRIKHYPFKKYKIGAAPLTKKRNVQISELILIKNCKVPTESRCELARDLFMLSFYLCGTNAVDFYHAEENNVVNGRFEYNRSKTEGRRQDKAFISIKIPDEAKPLLSKYLGKLKRRYSSYDGLDWALYKGMQVLRQLTGLSELTFYWARHTFANLARNECRMSIDDVGMALNHIDSGHVATDIYIAKDWQIVDDVQQNVISLLYFVEDSPDDISISIESNRKTMRLIVA